jgi:preprotein translocase subunit SecG
MRMFEGLEWKNALKRAAIFVGLWLGLVYVLSTAFPGSFGVQSAADLTNMAIFAIIFFFVYTVFFAFAERRKKRRLAEQKAQKKGKPGARVRAGSETPEGGEAGPDSLKGRHNPNTSRRKAARRRRR